MAEIVRSKLQRLWFVSCGSLKGILKQNDPFVIRLERFFCVDNVPCLPLFIGAPPSLGAQWERPIPVGRVTAFPQRTPIPLIEAEMNEIVALIGPEDFRWLAEGFGKNTVIKDIPQAILDRVAGVDVTLRDYSEDSNGLTAIALITFAYRMAGKSQAPHLGGKDILMVKVLAANELRRRGGNESDLTLSNLWDRPFYELVTGEVGERIRGMPTINSPS
jgi:hypothetical protein